MRDVSVFTVLSKWAKRSTENFTTDAFAWLLANDRRACHAVLDVIAANLDHGSACSHVVAGLRREDVLMVTTQRSLYVDDNEGKRRCFRPDLWITDASRSRCVLIEVKVWSPTTYQDVGVSEADDGEAGQKERANENVDYAPQTESYRRWLDQEYGENGVLLGLTVVHEPVLLNSCDGGITWQDVYLALNQNADTSDYAKMFCDYLGEKRMVEKDHAPVGESDIQVAVASGAPYERFSALLIAATTNIMKSLEVANFNTKRQGKQWLSLNPDDDGLWMWSYWIVTNTGAGRLWMTPYLHMRGEQDSVSADFVLGLSGDDIDIKAMHELLPAIAIHESDQEVLCSIPIPESFSALGSVAEQASEIAVVTWSNVLKPVLSRLSETS